MYTNKSHMIESVSVIYVHTSVLLFFFYLDTVSFVILQFKVSDYPFGYAQLS